MHTLLRSITMMAGLALLPAAMNAHEPGAASNGDTAGDNKSTLADRIRALQSSASRVTSTN